MYNYEIILFINVENKTTKKETRYALVTILTGRKNSVRGENTE